MINFAIIVTKMPLDLKVAEQENSLIKQLAMASSITTTTLKFHPSPMNQISRIVTHNN